MTSEIAKLLKEDNLADAARAAASAVKARPQDSGARTLLAALSVLQGDLARAETQASMAAKFAPDEALALGLFRQHLRGLHARDEWWKSGAVPGFPGGATEADREAVALNIALREGDGAGARDTLARLEDVRGARGGQWNECAADDLRDLDDRLPHAIEAISPGGHYLWIDTAKIARIAFRPVAGPLDLALRAARVTLSDGAEADLMLPAIYPAPESPALQLGRRTEFTESCGLTIGHGQRAYLAGDEMEGFLSAETISFEGKDG
ncbi:MAG: type VI secretion system accessory protein TagJ [Paracoccus sp. (in: a-proteobacteria)]|nr:type VI secretion system accessory protein TagJ [Paracoccus sp. (in: a-proteobacteria)]